jgi:hypothetical protein
MSTQGRADCVSLVAKEIRVRLQLPGLPLGGTAGWPPPIAVESRELSRVAIDRHGGNDR